MALRLKPNQPAGKQTKRIVGHEVEASLHDLSQQPTDPAQLDEIVHDVRKRLKKVRAVLSLVRDELGEKTYRRDTACVRESSLPLKDIRDAQALIETLDKLASVSSHQLSARAIADFRELLEARKQYACNEFWDNSPGYNRVLRKLRKTRVRSRNWKLKQLKWSDLRHGLQHVFVAGSRAFAVASGNQTAEHLHAWRKKVKCFWYQLQILQPVWQQTQDELGRELDQLAEILGDDHDLAILYQVVSAEAAATGHDADLVDLTIVIDERRSALERTAFELGSRVYERRPKALMEQIERWWKA
jgi:CHAD domain-containing protein